MGLDKLFSCPAPLQSTHKSLNSLRPASRCRLASSALCRLASDLEQSEVEHSKRNKMLWSLHGRVRLFKTRNLSNSYLSILLAHKKIRNFC